MRDRSKYEKTVEKTRFALYFTARGVILQQVEAGFSPVLSTYVAVPEQRDWVFPSHRNSTGCSFSNTMPHRFKYKVKTSSA